MQNQDLIRVGIVDDHAMLRKGFSEYLRLYPDIELIGEAADGEEGLALCAEQEPHVILMDLAMPVMDGLTAIRRIHQEFPAIKVIALTSFGEERLIMAVLEEGVMGFLLKKVSHEELARAIRAAHQSIATYSPEITKILMHSVSKAPSGLKTLTSRESEVLSLLAKGLSNAEISDTLQISPSTTKSHVSNILAKLNVTTRVEAILLSLEENVSLADFYMP